MRRLSPPLPRTEHAAGTPAPFSGNGSQVETLSGRLPPDKAFALRARSMHGALVRSQAPTRSKLSTCRSLQPPRDVSRLSAACKTLGEGGSQRYARPRGLRPRAPLYARTCAKRYSIKSLRLMFPQVRGERRPYADSRTILVRNRNPRRRNAKSTQLGLSTIRAEPHAARPASAKRRGKSDLAGMRRNVFSVSCHRLRVFRICRQPKKRLPTDFTRGM